MKKAGPREFNLSSHPLTSLWWMGLLKSLEETLIASAQGNPYVVAPMSDLLCNLLYFIDLGRLWSMFLCSSHLKKDLHS